MYRTEYYCAHSTLLEWECYISKPRDATGCPAERITQAFIINPVVSVSSTIHHLSCPLSSVARRALSQLQHLPKRSLRGKRAVGSDQPVRLYSHLAYFPPLVTALHRYRFQTAAAEGLAAHSDTQDGPSDTPHHWYHLCAHRCSPHHRQQ